MKELVSALGGDVFRTLATLILPGSLAVLPYYVLARIYFPPFDAIARANTPEVILCLIAGSLLAGLLLEDLGSEVESLFDSCRGQEVTDRWYFYLRHAYVAEPIGHRYMKTIVLRMKFESGVFFGVLAAGWGLWALADLAPARLSGPAVIHAEKLHLYGTVGLVVLEAYLLWSAWAGHSILCRVRDELAKGVWVVTEDGKVELAVYPASEATTSSSQELPPPPN